MANESAALSKRTWLGCPVVASADRLVIRPPVAYYVAGVLFLLLTVLLPWVMAEVGLLDRGIRAPVSAMWSAGILFFWTLLGRWWTLDRKSDSVRYFPWRLCSLSAVRGIRVVERRVGKRNLERAWTVDLDLEGG